MAKKESRGRQKIKMVRIKNPSHRQVTFSKRRLGLFKKASEICTLCGVEAFIIVFSPGQKVFSFGYPTVDTLVSRFLNHKTSPQGPNNSTKSEGVPQGSSLRELNSQLTRILDLLDAEKSRGDALSNMRKCNQSQWWWDAPIDKLDLHELEVLSGSMEVLKKNIAKQTMFPENNNSSSVLGMDGVARVPEHFDLKSMEVKVERFCLPHQFDNFYSQTFY